MPAEDIDRELSSLGSVPDDLPALVARTLGGGGQPLTLAEADELLGSLADRLADLPLPLALESQPLFANPAGAAEVSALFESRPPPAIVPTPVPPAFAASSAFGASAAFDAFQARAAQLEGPTVFDAPARVDPEVTAEAIAAAFDDDESGAELLARPSEAQLDTERTRRDTLTGSAPPPAAPSEPPPAFSAPPPAPEDDARDSYTPPALSDSPAAFERDYQGSRRPDLDMLLDQPLDALDFERSEPEQPATVPPAPASSPAAAASHDEPGSADADGDDFEILVDDEILEIAEDDVEMVDDDEK